MDEIQTEAAYLRRQRDEANVDIHERLDALEERLRALKMGICMDTAVRHEEDFIAIEADVTAIRIAADKLDD